MNTVAEVMWDQVHFIPHLLLALFILNWIKGKLNDEGSTYKALTYLLHG